MFYLGIDIARASHCCCLLNNEGEQVGKTFDLPSSQNSFNALIAKINTLKIDQGELLIGMEATGNLWENLYDFLNTKGFKVFLLNPFQTRKYRDLIGKKAKTDAIDSFVIAGLLRSGESTKSFVPDDQIQSLRDLVRLKNSLFETLKTYKRKAYALLNLIFPEYLTLVKNPFVVVSLAILKQFPSAKDVAGAKPRQILKIARHFQGNNFDEELAKRMISSAQSSIFSGRANQARGLALRVMLSQIEQLQNHIEQIEQAVEEILEPTEFSQSLGGNLLSIPGVGPKTVATLLAEVGDMQRFSSVKQLIGYVGLYPQISESGNSKKIPVLTKRGSPLLKHALYLAAVACVKHNPYLRKLYHQKVSQGKCAKQALIVVARKLLCIFYSMLKYNTEFDPIRLNLAVAV